MARTPKKKGGKLIVYPKQWPDTRVDKPEIDKEEPATPHLGHEYRLTKKFSEQTEKPKSARETFTKRFRFTRAKHMPHPAPIKGGHYKTTPQMEKPHYEEHDTQMGNKSYTQFVTEAAKRGRPRKLRPGEEADTLHIQDQLNKLTHPNHVEVHFKDGSKHRIPREHANMAIHHLNSLKPIERADHAEHMAKSHNDFYHVLSKKSIPSKKKGISLAGPKLRKEEVEQIDELHGKGSLEKIRDYHKNKQAEYSARTRGLEDTTLDRYKKMKSTVVVTHSSGKKEVIPGHGEAEFTAVQRNKDTMKAKRDLEGMKVKRATGLIKKRKSMKEDAEQIDELSKKTLASYVKKAGGASLGSVGDLMYQAANADPTAKDNRRVDLFKKAGKRAKGVERAASRLAKEEAEHDDGWYAHKEMHGSKAISKEDWKKGVRPKKSMKKEEAEQVVEWGKQAITGPHAKTGSMAITPPKVGYKGKTKKPKVQELTREEASCGSSYKTVKASLMKKANREKDSSK